MNIYQEFLKEKGLVVTGSLEGKNFLIDPGHGGSDTGAVANGLIERDINLPMSFDFGGFLQFLGATVTYTRTNNKQNPSLRARADQAIYEDVDFMFPQHNNGGGGDGFEAFHTTYINNSQGDEMANAIGKAIEKYSHQNTRRVTDRVNSSGKDYYALHRYTKHITTIILEGGFLDGDVQDIDTMEERRAIAFSEALGVAEYYGILEERTLETVEATVSDEIGKIIRSLMTIKSLIE
jgi:N-acetylmuramoyl-L-alanine amidase